MSETWTVEQFRAYQKEGVKPHPKVTTRPRKSALKAADAAFSILMRATEANEQGVVRCCTCQKWLSWKGTGNAHWGHWQSRGFNSVRFDPKNGGIQCRVCNTYLEGRKQDMEAYLIQRYGEGEVNRVRAYAGIQTKISNQELAEMAAKFRAEAREIIKQKNLKA